MTRTAEMADVVLPGTASWCEAEGTVTNSERRVQRVRKALDPPGEARDDMWILAELARRLGHDWGQPTAEEVWDELRSLSPMHRGMSYDRLEEHRGLQWPCPDEDAPRLAVPPRRGSGRSRSRGRSRRSASSRRRRRSRRSTPTTRSGSRPAGGSSRTTPGAQTNRYRSPLHRGESLDLSPEDAERLRLADGEIVRVSSRRGSVEAPVRIDPSLRAGLAFMTFHFPDAGRHEPADDRRHRPQVGHRRVQGRRDPGREARARGRDRLMDLHLVPHAEPTDAERAALDAARPADLGWDGGPRATGSDGNTAAGGHDARARRHLLLPALWALQERIGWISPGGLNEVCRRLTVPPADAYGVATFYALLALEPRPRRVVHVCEDIACRCNGADGDRRAARGALRARGRAREPTASATWYRSPCLGQCDRAPAALVAVAGDEPLERARRRRVPRTSLALLAGGEPAASPERRRSRRRATRSLRLLRRVGVVDPGSLDDYRAHGGYAALRRAIELGPEGVIREVKDSKLLGRGGAAFPTGVKWEAVARQPARPHYLVCNADESEPGTFKDRVLIEGDPFALVEAMTIAAYATGCEHGYVYLRGEYPRGAARARARARRGAAARLPRRRRAGRGLRVRHRDPQRRRRVHLRRGDGDLRVDRGQARRAAQQAAVPRRGGPLRQADRGQQRRDARQRARRRPPLAARRSPRPGPSSRPGRSSSASPGTSSGPGTYEVAFGATLARPARPRRRRARRPRAPGGAPRRRRGQLPRARTSSTCRSPSRARARRGRRSARGSCSSSTTPSTSPRS